jgi:hypothetical protein
VLIGVPPIALVILGTGPDAATFDHAAWIFAAYLALAWLLLLGVVVRPEHVTRPMLVLVTAIALATQVPLAVALIGYAKAGSGGGPHAAADAMLPALSGSRTQRPWWEH